MSLFFRAGITQSALVLAAGVALFAQPPTADEQPELDYLYFRERVEPILVETRDGKERCVTCHTPDSLFEDLPPGEATRSDDRSRRYFEIWRKQVVPGRPMDSPFLTRPLATEAGGSIFHTGGKRWGSRADREWLTLAAWVRGQALGGLAMPWSLGFDRVLQANPDGDRVLVVDPATREVVGAIEDIAAPGGIAIAADGRRVYVANRVQRTLDVVDVGTLEVFKRIHLSGVPSDVDTAEDGKRIYVGIRGDIGGVDVIDARRLIRTHHIPVDGSVESVRLTPDGTHLFAGTPEVPVLQGIDVVSHDAVTWRAVLGAGVETMDFVKRGDGSTRSIVVQLRGQHGFTVIDFGTRRVVEQVAPPGTPSGAALSYGLTLDPAQTTLWVASSHDDSVVAYGVPSRCRPGQSGPPCAWERLESVAVGRHPAWLTVTPDGQTLYVSLTGENAAALVDTATMGMVEKLSTGDGPGRNVAGTLATR